jgi:O-antigen ligase
VKSHITRNIRFLVLLILLSLIEIYFLDKLYALGATTRFGLLFVLFSTVLFAFLCFSLVACLLKENYSMAVGSIICILPIIAKFPVKYNIYTDYAMRENFFTFTGILTTLILLVILFNNRKTGLVLNRLKSNSDIIFAIIVLFFSCMLTQVVNLGVLDGISIVITRILIPFSFLLCIILSIQERQDIYIVFSSIIISMVIAMILGNIGTIIDYSESGLRDITIKRAHVEGFASWTMFGTLLSLAVPILICMFLIVKKVGLKILLFTVLLTVIFTIFSTHTRGALLMSSIIVLLIANRKIHQSYNLKPIIVMFVLLFIVFYSAIATNVASRAWGIDKIRSDTSFNSRLERIEEAFNFALDNVFIGIGFGKPVARRNPKMAFYIYNGFLSWWVFSGLIGMLAFIYLNVRAITKCFSFVNSHENEDYLIGITMLSIIVGWMINQVTTADQLTYFHSIESVSFYYIHLGIICSLTSFVSHKKT